MLFDPTILAAAENILLSDASYIWVIIFLILTGCGLPIPEEVAIIACGAWAADGQMNPWLGMASCLVGCLIGDSIMYFIGYRFGRSVLRDHPVFTRFLTPEREKQIELLIRRRGFIVLFTSRFLVGIRSPVYLTAGILRYPYWRFILTDLFCAAVVIAVFFGLGWYFGPEIKEFVLRAERGLTIVIAIGVIVGGLLFWWHRQHSKKLIEKLDEVTAATSSTPANATAMTAVGHTDVGLSERNGVSEGDSRVDEQAPAVAKGE